MKKVDFIFYFDSIKEAKIIFESLQPEVAHKIPKTKIKTYLNKKKLNLIIEAEDVSTLRAACNSYLKWINTAANVEKII